MSHRHSHENELQYVPSRRSLLGKTAGLFAFASAVQLGTVFVKAAAPLNTPTPEEIEGPYWRDVQLDRSDIRSDPTTGAVEQGLDLRLAVSMSKLANGRSTPVAGAYIDIWHCNADGEYSDEPAGMGQPDTSAYKYLRGYQVTNAHGMVNFLTLYPGWYSGRTPHIHARVRIYSGSTATTNFTTQFFFDEDITNYVYGNVAPYNARSGARDTTNATDSVYTTVSTGSTSANPDGTRLMLRMSDDGTYVIGSFNIVLT